MGSPLGHNDAFIRVHATVHGKAVTGEEEEQLHAGIQAVPGQALGDAAITSAHPISQAWTAEGGDRFSDRVCCRCLGRSWTKCELIAVCSAIFVSALLVTAVVRAFAPTPEPSTPDSGSSGNSRGGGAGTGIMSIGDYVGTG
eukprot:gb/GFBE01039321.1/.p1 GENE.gb/GFBE01039321.1/~~gb/GFBE01039321.1/.p1  ORF type:complete len:142 (+),score=23.36 gb/GFBE01039321.1/:1-426(+)